ncbi:prepilin-type N-terminal cleavage/methylation domain-containing protein [bacterium]|nr:prepilin-type N-terminal cleavage/methylation domain-containing protein [bacterium]MBU4511463.1 prepilin-type N-terminal cleavage/methylation domain-containing protein [bacterium]
MSTLNIKNQKGFSLIEMMVVVAVLGVIVLGLATFFTGGTKSWVSGQSQLTAQRNARQAMDRMVREIREGELIESSSGEKYIEISFPDSFAKSNVIFSWSGTPGDPISRSSIPLINDVKTLNFTYPDASKVHILLEVDVDKDGNPDITLNTNVNLRNYGF